MDSVLECFRGKVAVHVEDLIINLEPFGYDMVKVRWSSNE